MNDDTNEQTKREGEGTKTTWNGDNGQRDREGPKERTQSGQLPVGMGGAEHATQKRTATDGEQDSEQEGARGQDGAQE